LALAVIRAVGAPLAAPSANRFGRISPTSAADVIAELGDRIPLVLDGGPCAVGVESTVIAVGEQGELTLLRPGGIPPEAIERIAGTPPRSTPSGVAPASSPGMLPSHYAPRKRLLLLEPDRLPELGEARTLGLLAFSGDEIAAAAALAARTGRAVIGRVLSPAGDLEQAARGLFAALRWLDASPAEVLLAEPIPGGGLGHAIRDRLARAAGRE
jgi:L-threonylcarbamoyladenylate synthase